MNASTFVVDYTTLYESMPVTVFYSGDTAVPAIYPPQYEAAVIAPRQEGQNVFVGYFNNLLMSSDQSLKLNLAPTTQVVTSNNQTSWETRETIPWPYNTARPPEAYPHRQTPGNESSSSAACNRLFREITTVCPAPKEASPKKSSPEKTPRKRPPEEPSCKTV